MNLRRSAMTSPIGTVVLYTKEHSLTQAPVLAALGFEDCEEAWLKVMAMRFGRTEVGEGSPPKTIGDRIEAYFAGDTGALADVAVDAPGTPFQTRVWNELRRIPAGETRSYSAIATSVSAPKAVRAVGSANARNLLALVIPCHRVVGLHGRPCGYAGGFDRKAWLLEHERQALRV